MPKEPITALGRNLRAARLAAGLTQEQAAAKGKMRQSLWSMYEGGSRTPSLKMLARLAKVVGVTSADLLKGQA